MLTREYNKEKGMRLSIGDGRWYMFFDTRKDFYERHRFNEKRRMNGVLWWRNIGRIVFVKDVVAYVKKRNYRRIDQRHSKVVVK